MTPIGQAHMDMPTRRVKPVGAPRTRRALSLIPAHIRSQNREQNAPQKLGGFCPIVNVFDKLVEPPPFHCVEADGNTSILRFWGKITLKSNTGSTRKVKIKRVYYAPMFLRTLLSGDGLDDEGYYCETDGGGLRIRYGQESSQESILLLPRVPELEDGTIGDVAVTHLPKRGPVAFDKHPMGRGWLPYTR